MKGRKKKQNKSVLYSNYSSGEHKIFLNNRKYILYWTPTAEVRAELSCKGNRTIYGVYLRNVLADIAKKTKILDKRKGYLTIRDFKTGLYAVINIKDNKIRVITCGNVRKLYPYYGDYIIQRNEDGEILNYVWEFKNNHCVS